jgi:hypothetical protein
MVARPFWPPTDFQAPHRVGAVASIAHRAAGFDAARLLAGGDLKGTGKHRKALDGPALMAFGFKHCAFQRQRHTIAAIPPFSTSL